MVYHIPSVPPASAAHALRARQLTLGIERTQRNTSHQHPTLACTSLGSQQELIAALRARGVFKEVNFVDRLPSPPDLVLKDAFMGTYHPVYEPLVTMLSLGLVPQTQKRPYLLEYQLADRTGAVVSTVQTEEEDPSVIGWVALPMKLHPEWSGKRVDSAIIMGRFAADIEKSAGSFSDRRGN